MTTEKLKTAIEKIKSGDKLLGRKILSEYLKENPSSESGWMWLSVCLDSVEQKQFCLEKVLKINPNNTNAQKALEQLVSPPQPQVEEITATQLKEKKKEHIASSGQKPVYRQSPVDVNKIGNYIRTILLPGESVLEIAKIHWIVFIIPGILSLLAILATGVTLLPLIGLSSVATSSDIAAVGLAEFTICTFPIWVFAIIGIARSILQYKTTEFALTNKRLIGKVGIIRRNSLELVLEKIESISVNQGILGRILDYGTLIISGSGGTHQNFPNISEPMKLKQRINSVLP